ncbi:hypothetical protein S40293_04109 [Stachybotrys chartarum IBT 40293]|nr:hypothetical protein S40293_04109 [Stachybotrys chartarum IBT 40293]
MASTTSGLLSLPIELRVRVWEECAANGAWVDLLQCNRQIHQELSPICTFPDEDAVVERMVITVDSSYVRGRWLSVRCHWSSMAATGPSRRSQRVLEIPLQYVNCAFCKRLWNTTTVREIEINLVAPRTGHFFGAFLMMLAKFSDLTTLLCWTAPRHVFFLTDVACSHDDGQVRHNQSSFWKCRFDNELLVYGVRRPEGTDGGSLPFAWEFFLPESIRLVDEEMVQDRTQHPVPIHLPSSLPCMAMNADYRTMISSLALADGFHGARADGIRDWETLFETRPAANFMEAIWIISDASQNIYNEWMCRLLGCLFGIIVTEIDFLKSLLSTYLDHHTGPPGGAMDMLRLHRFKTYLLSPDQYLASTRVRYNPRENSTSPERPRRLGGVIQDVTLHFMRLFNPLAERQVRLLRDACPHLRQVQWPKACSDGQATDFVCPPHLWVDSYPQGICYRQTSGPGDVSHSTWDSKSIARWGHGQKSKTTMVFFGPKGCRPYKAVWECIMCCTEARCAHVQLCSDWAKRRLIPSVGWVDTEEDVRWVFRDIGPVELDIAEDVAELTLMRHTACEVERS